MSDQKYRLIRRQFFRSITTNGEVQTLKFVRGDIMVPTANELRYHKSAFEGPVDDDGPVADGAIALAGGVGPAPAVAPSALLSKAQQAAVMQLPAMKNIIRDMTIDELDELQNAEQARSNGPRQAVMDVIIRRRKSLVAALTKA